MKLKIILLIAVLLAIVFPTPAHADGMIIPLPPPCLGARPCPPSPVMTQLAIKYHHVTVTIADQIAVTHVDQVFFNPNNWPVEGEYIFPLPKDAAVSSFTLWIDGQPVQGELLKAEQARQKYREIVQSLRDPALLEYADRGAMQAHIFPIPPQGERRIELEYSQALLSVNGLVRYNYPLNTEKFSAIPLENVTINLDIRASIPIRAAYSPSHSVAINRQDDHHLTVGYEASNVLPDADFALYYSLGETEAFHLLTYRDPSDLNDPDGFFLLLLAPRPEAVQTSVAKDMLLVLDRSGSMEGDKFNQAQEALRFILRHLNPQDRFNIIAFSTGLETYTPGLRPASEALKALAWVDSLNAQGSTDINRALLEAGAMTDPERPTYLIFMTDGLPTQGEVDPGKILKNLSQATPKNIRLFTFGVGYDVDTYLLDSLAQAHHGASTYVQPNENLDEIISAFYARISVPILTDLKIDFGDMATYDIYPSPLPDLFRDSQIIAVGRYRQAGATTVTLTGKVNDEVQTFSFPNQVFPAQTLDLQESINNPQTSIPRLWATRKIGTLLNGIRLNGPNQETIDQIVRLSIRYGIVTPYTSYLVTEPLPLGVEEQARIAGEQYNQMAAAPTAPASGQSAVQKAAGQGSLAAADAPSAPSMTDTAKVRIIGARTFVLNAGKWIDTAFDPERMKTQKVDFLSQEYYDLIQEHPDLAAAFALGQSVIAITEGAAYEVTPSSFSASATDLPLLPTPKPLTSNPATLTISPRSTPIPSINKTPERAASAPTLPCSAGAIPILSIALAAWIMRYRSL